jgi:hypothetical protein
MFAMYQKYLLLIIIGLCLAVPVSAGFAQQGTPTATATPVLVYIKFPPDGQALKGKVAVSGNTSIQGFSSSEVSFSYSDNPTGTWFLIQSSTQPVKDGVLVEWDTSTITDGVFDMRLEVKLVTGESIVYTVRKLRVRNYTPVETETPTPVTPTSTPLPGDTPIPTATSTPTETPVPPTRTALPSNPAQVTRQELGISLGKGVLFTLGLFALMGIYLSVKTIRKRI